MLPQRGRNLEDSITGASSLLCVRGPQVRSRICHLFPSSFVAQYQVWWGGVGWGRAGQLGSQWNPKNVVVGVWSEHTRPSCSYLIPLSSSRDLLLRFGTESLLTAPSFHFTSQPVFPPNTLLLPPPSPTAPNRLGFQWGVNKVGQD